MSPQSENLFLTLMEGWENFVPIRGTKPVSEASIASALDLVGNRKGLPSHKWEYLLREAITTTDFPYLLGHVLDRELIARYKVAVADWKTYFDVRRVRDFNLVERHKVTGADDRLPEVAEKGEYLVSEMSAGFYSYKVKKYGRQFDISWESLINDSLGAFEDIPERYANAAIRTEAFNATSTFVAATGPHPGLFGTPVLDPADGGWVTNLNTLPLTIANLETTLEAMAAQLDVNGEPISVWGAHLVVPRALEFTARQILTSGMKMWVDVQGGAGATIVPYPTTNVVSTIGLKLHVDPYIPIIDVSANALTTWYLFADPAQGAAMEFGYLRGHETPEICMKASDKVTVGGAAISPFAGDFATDNIFYRVRLVKGTCRKDPRFAYSQDGSDRGQ